MGKNLAILSYLCLQLFCFSLTVSGVLNDRELRTLAAILYPIPISVDELHAVEGNLKNCSIRLRNAALSTNATYQKPPPRVTSEVYYDPDMPLVTKQLFMNCHEVWRMMNKSAESAKYKHELMGEDDMAFKMIRNNVTQALNMLDWIRKNRRKFICINDDLDHDREDSKLVRRLLRDFYESLLPLPSQFELKPNYVNRFLYKKDLDDWLKQNELFSNELEVLAALLVCVLFIYLFRNKMRLCFATVVRLFFNRQHGNRRYRNNDYTI